MSSLGYFLGFCIGSSLLSTKRLRFIVVFVFDADFCRVVRRSSIGDCVCSIVVDESKKESRELSDNVD